MTTAIITARYFGGNQQTACAVLKTLFQCLAEVFKAKNPNHSYSIDTYPVAVCDNIHISHSRLYQGKIWRSKHV